MIGKIVLKGREQVSAKPSRYTKLLSNTLILTIGTLGSKVLMFLLTPLYTSFLTKGEYGIIDLLVSAANLLIPLVSLGMNTAVLRFGMDGQTDGRTVLTTGLVVDLLGFGCFLLFFPLVDLIPSIQGYTGWIYLFIFTAMLRYLFAYFVKTLQKLQLFAISGVIGTAVTLLLDILFLAVLKIGIIGYLLAIVLADVISMAILFFGARLYRYIRLPYIRKDITRNMLKYSLPLIPSSALWWITDASDRYMIAGMISEEANGLYAISYKVPNLLIILSGIFMDAWNISFLSENSPLERQRFFSRIFDMYQSIIFVCSTMMILFTKVITRILVSDSFYASWEYMPTLIIAMALSCFVSFIGTVYTVEKRSKSALWTTLAGTVFNVIGNFTLISLMGVQGAALSTALSYAMVLLIRAVDTHRYMPITWNIPRFGLSVGILIAQALILVLEPSWWIIAEVALAAVMIILHGKRFINGVGQLLAKRKG